MHNPGRLFLMAVVVILAGFIIQVELPFQDVGSHGSGPYLAIDNGDALVLKGQEVYRQEGCQYCHTKNLRPFTWEVKRFTDEEKLGYFPLSNEMEYYYEAPYTMGASRVGPDLSRIATKMSGEDLEKLLSSPDQEGLVGAYHNYSNLFTETYEESDGLALSWRIKAMLETGLPLNFPYAQSAFKSVVGKTRGDALVAYLNSLGRKQMEYAGNFFK